jgi:hypothetical protein
LLDSAVSSREAYTPTVGNRAPSDDAAASTDTAGPSPGAQPFHGGWAGADSGRRDGVPSFVRLAGLAKRKGENGERRLRFVALFSHFDSWRGCFED